MKSKHIVGLDFVRFLAAFAVMAFHLFYSAWLPVEGARGAGAIAPISSFPAFGWVGVQIFFVISGFVICYSADQATPFRFFSSRLVRLVPGAWICATITLGVIVATKLVPDSVAFSRWFSTVLFSPKPPFIDTVYWTLGVEIFFYSIVFILLCLNEFKRVELLAIVLIISGLVSLVLSWAVGGEKLAAIQHSREFTVLLGRHGCFFALGVLMWLSMRGLNWRRGVLMLICIFLGIVQIIDEHASKVSGGALSQTSWFAIAVWLLALLAMVASIRWRDRIPSTNWIRTLGLMTYPLYLVHNIVGVEIIKRIAFIGGPALAACVTMILMIALSWLVTVTLERWGQEWLHRVLDETGMKSRLSVPFLFRRSQSPFA